MSEHHPFRNASYLLSVHTPRQLPTDDGLEVAISGRSNAGKSSAINRICSQTGLARTSKTPGRTQQLVYFQLAAQRYLVDLPGYGFAKVPPELREHWRGLIEGYFQTRRALAGLVVVMDIRHPMREFDCQMIEFALARRLPCHVLLTKADKLGRGAQGQTLREIRTALAQLGPELSVQLFSAHDGSGVEEARARLAGWLRLGADTGDARG
jgi:GTP-binding protein